MAFFNRGTLSDENANFPTNLKLKPAVAHFYVILYTLFSPCVIKRAESPLV